MEIYSFKFSFFMCVIYALMAIGMAIVATFVIKSVFLQINKESKNGSKIQLDRILVFTPFIIIPSVLFILFCCLFAKYTSFDYNMTRGKASFLEGDVAVISCEEDYYRGSFSGYIVVIELDDQRISPANVFSEDVVDAFKSDKTLIVQYGEIKNDGTYIWSVKVLE